jgi:DNA polymerase I
MDSFFGHDDNVLMLVDAHAIIYRAYFAFPPLNTADGTLVNAAFGFTRILLTAIRDVAPMHIAVVFDHPTPTFRHKEYTEYKAHREKMPDDLQPQVQLVKDVVDALNIPRFEMSGYEADDLIGTLSTQASAQSIKTVIVTGDRDLFQLVNELIHVWLPGKGNKSDEEYDRERVQKKMEVFPEQVVDLKALMGDSSDNIPGVTGIGQKTATKLIAEFGSLEALYQAIESGQSHPLLKGAVLAKLQTGKEQAFLSQRLATIATNAPITLDIDACQVTGYNKEQAVDLFQRYEFRSLVGLLPNDEFESGVQEALF